MGQSRLLLGGWMALIVAGTSGVTAQEQVTDLSRLAATLDFTDPGVRRWLDHLGVRVADPSGERLLAVSVTGEPLMARQGERSVVEVGPELDDLLRGPDRAVVLVHNHPSNVGLSVADLGQLTKPGVAAIVAVGHDGSVFMASAGPRMDPDFFEERQYAMARAEVLKRLRTESRSIPSTVRDAHFSHLVSLVLSRAGILDYWFTLRGTGRESYEQARIPFGRVVTGAAARLSR